MFWMGPLDMGRQSRLPGIIAFLFDFPNSKPLEIVNPQALRTRWRESKPESRGAVCPVSSGDVFENMKVTPRQSGMILRSKPNPLPMAIWPGRVLISMTLTLINLEMNGYPPVLAPEETLKIRMIHMNCIGEYTGLDIIPVAQALTNINAGTTVWR